MITLLIIFLITTNVHSKRILAFQISYSANRPYINLRFIKENYQYDFLLNTYIPFSFINFGDDVPIREENIGKDIEINFIESYKGFEYHSSIQIDNSILVNSFNYILTKSDIKYFPDNGLSLTYKPKNEEYSLTHQLYKQGLFDNLQFAFSPNDIQHNKGFLYFGGVPLDEVKRFPIKKDIEIDKGYDSWGFKLKGVKYYNIFHLYDRYTAINSCLIDLIYSNEVMALLQEILKEKINKKICNIESPGGNVEWISCENFIEEFEQTINIKFESITITLLIKDLFSVDYIKKYTSKVKSNNYKYYDKMNILGADFLLLFNLTVFDYEKGIISFYTDNPFLFTSIQNNNAIVKKTLILIILVCIINVILLIYYQFLNRKQ